MVKKFLFIQPTIYDDYGRLIKKNKLYFIGLTGPLLAAMLPKDWECEVCIESIEDIPFDAEASIIGIGSMGHSLKRAWEIADEFRKRGKKVVIGGMMASLMPNETKEHCDSVVVGDAEEIFTQLITDAEKGVIKPFYKKFTQTLQTPEPKYELITSKSIGDFLPVQAGRGCPHSCSFCSIACLYRSRYLRRDVDDVMRDIKKIKELGFNKFLLIDDNIMANRSYIITLCQKIKPLKMQWMSQCTIRIAEDKELLAALKASGCATLSFGLESIDQQNLKSVNKSWADPATYSANIKVIQNYGIDIAAELIVGLDGDTPKGLRDPKDFVIKNHITFPKYYILTPIPGTDLYAQFKKSNRIDIYDISKYSPSKAVINHPHMSRTELNDIYWSIYRSTYSINAICKRLLLDINAYKHPVRTLFNLGVNLFYRYQIKNGVAPIIV